MIKIRIGTNLNVKNIIEDPNKTIKQVLEENEINYATGGIHLDGLAIGGPDLNKTFADQGITESCILLSVIKADGGC